MCCSVTRKIATYTNDILEGQADKLQESFLINGSKYITVQVHVCICTRCLFDQIAY